MQHCWRPTNKLNNVVDHSALRSLTGDLPWTPSTAGLSCRVLTDPGTEPISTAQCWSTKFNAFLDVGGLGFVGAPSLLLTTIVSTQRAI